MNPSRKSDRKISSLSSSIAGAVAGGVSRLAISPLDVIKIRMQVTAHESGSSMSMVRVVRSILKEEGARTFWRGNVAAQWLWMSYTAIQFPMYHWATDYMKDHSPRFVPQAAIAGAAGASGAIVGTVTTYPFDYMRTQFAVQGVPRRFHSLAHLARSTIRNHGVQGLFHGLSPALVSIIPYITLQFAAYNVLQKWLTQDHFGSLASISASGAAGFGAGLIAKLATYPLDTVKKSLQVQNMGTHALGDAPVYRGSYHCFHSILKTQGVRGLYRGCVPGLIKVAPAAGITFFVYEATCTVMSALPSSGAAE